MSRLQLALNVPDLEAAIDFSINTVGLTWATRDQKEGMSAFLEKRTPSWKGR